MGLRRRLSKKWNETVNGILRGPGVDVDSVKTRGLVINNVDVEQIPLYQSEASQANTLTVSSNSFEGNDNYHLSVVDFNELVSNLDDVDLKCVFSFKTGDVTAFSTFAVRNITQDVTLVSLTDNSSDADFSVSGTFDPSGWGQDEVQIQVRHEDDFSGEIDKAHFAIGVDTQ